MATKTPQPIGSPSAPPASRLAWSRWALAALVVLAVGIFYALGLYRYFSWDYLRAHLDLLQAEVERHFLAAVLLFFAVYVAVTALSLPVAAILSLLGGALFGRWVGTGVVCLAATLGATAAFLTSRYLFRETVRRWLGARWEPLDQGVRQEGAYYLFTLRLVPLFPFWLINLSMGLTALPVRTFFWVSLVGMLPGTFLYVNAGRALATIDSPQGILSPGVIGSLVLLGVAPLLIRKLTRRKIKARAVALVLGILLAAALVVLALWIYI